MAERAKDKKLIRKHEHMDVNLDDEQSDELGLIVDTINEKSSDVLSQVFEEAEKEGKGTDVREIWENDTRTEREEYERDQSRNSKTCRL